jgi:hypothetical protein
LSVTITAPRDIAKRLFKSNPNKLVYQQEFKLSPNIVVVNSDRLSQLVNIHFTPLSNDPINDGQEIHYFVPVVLFTPNIQVSACTFIRFSNDFK